MSDVPCTNRASQQSLDIVHVLLFKIHFTEMSSVRTRFEDISHNAPPIFPNPVSPKRVSKRDEPKEVSPPSPISHPDEEVMSPDSTRHLIAKFANKEEDREMTSPPPMSPRWKPVHRITPPRDLLRESIEDAQINGTSDAEEEDQEEFNPDIVKSSNEYVIPEELPVPEKTRSILAKFRSMEDVNAPPLSPTKSVKKPFAMPPESSHSAPNLGAADSVVVNGNDDVDIQPEVIRPDGQEKYLEGEFPEYGLTKNLLARWRTLEQQNEKKAMFPTTPKLQKRQSDPACVFHQKEPVEVVRMSATDDEGETGGREECLPAHCYTRNILSKFQSMEVQAETKTPKKVQLPLSLPGVHQGCVQNCSKYCIHFISIAYTKILHILFKNICNVHFPKIIANTTRSTCQLILPIS